MPPYQPPPAAAPAPIVIYETRLPASVFKARTGTRYHTSRDSQYIRNSVNVQELILCRGCEHAFQVQ